MKSLPGILKSFARFFSYFLRTKPALPEYIILDPVNICNLKCPLCATGLNGLKHNQSIMNFESFKVILEKLPGKRHLILSNWGEPFLNKEIFRMISYAKQKDFYVQLDSHFCIQKEDLFFKEIITSGLDEITISLDGCSQETYSKYRMGGNFALVMNNLSKLVEIKKIKNSTTPKIIWKFIVNKYNEHDIGMAHEIAAALEVGFVIEKMGLGNDMVDFSFNQSLEERKKEWLPEDPAYIRNDYLTESIAKQACPFLNNIIAITPDGKVFPCCYMIDEKNCFGDLLKESLEEIWYNQRYQSSRNLFIRRKKNDVETICAQCPVYSNKRKVEK